MKIPVSVRSLPVFTFLSLSLLCATPASAKVEGSGKVVTEKRDVKGIKSVETKGFGDLEIVQDGTESLSLTGEDNILPLITTEVDGHGTLVISVKKNESITTHEKLRINISVKELDSLKLSGSGNVHAKALKTSEANGAFAINLEGSGNVNLDKLDGGSFKLELDGSGNVKVAGGEVSDQKVDINGSGGYEGAAFKSKTADVSVAGSGDVEVWAADKLNVNVEGSGDVDYKGKPEVKKSIHGSGSVGPLTD